VLDLVGGKKEKGTGPDSVVEGACAARLKEEIGKPVNVAKKQSEAANHAKEGRAMSTRQDYCWPTLPHN